MQKQGKKLFSVVLISLLIIIILYKKSDPKNLREILLSANKKYLILAALSFLMYSMMEAVSFQYLLKKFGYKIRLTRTWGYAMSDFFFSTITPGGSGGQPGQLFFMARDNISPGACMMSLFPFNLVYHVWLIIYSVFAMIWLKENLVWNSLLRPFIVYGILAQLLFVLVLALLIFNESIIIRIKDSLFRLLEKIKWIKNLDEKKARVDNEINEYAHCVHLLKGHSKMFIALAPLIFLMLFFSYSVSYWVYRSLGYHELTWAHMILIQSLIIVAVESVPIPGSVGIVEAGMLGVYNNLVPDSNAFAWMFLTRSLSFYFGLILGGIKVSSMKKENFRRGRKGFLRRKKNVEAYASMDSETENPYQKKEK